jgi:hypothetical protein
MAWDWSHTAEAYANARENLAHLELVDLHIIFGEWRANQLKGGINADNFTFNEYRYRRAIPYAESLSREALEKWIWEKMEAQALCTNGGHDAWCCPYGCHVVTFDKKEE